MKIIENFLDKQDLEDLKNIAFLNGLNNQMNKKK